MKRATSNRQPRFHGRTGGALVMGVVLLVTLAGLSLSMITVLDGAARENRTSREKMGSHFVAEAGLSQAFFELNNGGTGVIGTSNQPMTFGDSTYWVTSTPMAGGLTSLISTGFDGRYTSRIQLVVQDTTSSSWSWGAFGDTSMILDSNALVDSYDSSLGTYASQLTTSGSNAHANSNGNVGSNQNVLLQQNSDVFGNAIPGPGGSTTILGNATVSGTTTPNNGSVTMDPVTVPAIPSIGDLDVNGSVSIPSGTHAFDAGTIETGSTLTITGPATLVFDSLELESNASFLVDSTGGPVEVYVVNDFLLNSNTLMAPLNYSPGDLIVNLASDNIADPNLNVDLDQIDFNSNAQFYGILYAPSAAIVINSNFELFGSLMSSSLELNSNSKVHFDEALLQSSSSSSSKYQKVLWNVLQ